MKRLLSLFTLLLIVSIAFAQIPEEAAIRNNIEAFSRALMNRDIDFVVGSYTADASIFPNGSEIIKGREGIRAYWTPANGDTTTFHIIYPEEITVVDDNTAYDYGYYEVSGIADNRAYNKVRGKYVIVWKKIDGQWKIHLDIWNRVNL